MKYQYVVFFMFSDLECMPGQVCTPGCMSNANYDCCDAVVPP